MSSIQLVVGLVAFILLSLQFGQIVVRVMREKFIADSSQSGLLINPALKFFIGQSSLSFLWVVVSLLLPAPWNLLLFLIIIIFLVWKFGTWEFLKLKTKYRPLNFSEYVFAFLLLLVFAFYLILSLHKSTEWDDVAYHQPVVEELAAGKIQFPLLTTSPYTDFYAPFTIFYGSLPFNFEAAASILYTLTFSNLAASPLLNLINVFFFLYFLVYYLKERYGFHINAFLVLAFAICTNYGITIIFSTGLIDLTTAIYQLLAVLYLLSAIEKKSKLFFYVSICLLAASFGYKFTSLFLLPAYAVIGVYAAYLLKLTRKDYLLLPLLSILFGFYWYLKNLILYFNPVYPLYFGHPGMTESEFAFLNDSLINNIRVENSLDNLLGIIKTSYSPETSTQVAAILAFIHLAFHNKRSRSELLLILAFTSFAVLNFFIGSQLSRYVLALPLALHLTAYPLLLRINYLKYFVLIIILYGIWHNPVQYSVFNARFNAVRDLVVAQKSIDNVQCSKQAVEYLEAQNAPVNSVLNLWDPYAAVFYRSKQLFFNFQGKINLDNFVLPTSIKYIYIHNQQMESTLATEALHPDMKPVQRFNVQTGLLKESNLVFKYADCVIYEKEKYE